MSVATTKSHEVSVETGAGLERKITVRVPAADIEREIDARLKKVSRTAKLKGFRPGKVPEKVVRQYYGGQVRDEVLTEVIRTSYARAIAEQKLNPAGGPRIEPLTDSQLSGADHFAYSATFEVFPEVKLGPLDKLSVEVPKVEIGDADVDAMIDKLRAQRAEWQTVERQAAEKDRVVVDFAGTIDGQPFKGGESKDVSIVVGAGQVIEDFDKALIGVAAGDTKTAKVTFPDDYPAENLAGKKAEFEITVHRVEEQVQPVLDDAFAATFGVTEGGVERLRSDVRSNMERELAERLKAETKTRVFDALVAANAIALPRALVTEEIENLQADAMRQMGLKDPKQAPAPERFANLAERRVRVGLLIQELIKEHKIKLDQDRVDARVKELSAPYEKPEEAARFYRSNRQMMAQIESTALEEQVVDLLLEQASTKEKALSFQDFMGA
jgi:trigger factor